jgi:hypothetical protein
MAPIEEVQVVLVTEGVTVIGTLIATTMDVEVMLHPLASVMVTV